METFITETHTHDYRWIIIVVQHCVCNVNESDLNCVCVVQRVVNEDKSPVGPWLLALFVFVVCGSGKMRNKTQHLFHTYYTHWHLTFIHTHTDHIHAHIWPYIWAEFHSCSSVMTEVLNYIHWFVYIRHLNVVLCFSDLSDYPEYQTGHVSADITCPSWRRVKLLWTSQTLLHLLHWDAFFCAAHDFWCL